jgi:hypothetical protein
MRGLARRNSARDGRCRAWPAFPRISQTQDSAFPRRDRRPGCLSPSVRHVLRKGRAQGMPGACRTRGLVCKRKSIRVSHHRYAGHSGIPCAMVLRFPSRSPRGSAFLPPSPVRCAGIVHQVDLSVERSGPHDFAVRISAFRLIALTRPPHSMPNVRDDREAPLRIGPGTGRAGRRDLPDGARGREGVTAASK